MLMSFYIGYIPSNFIGGWAADRWGAKWVLVIGTGFSSVASLITPILFQKAGWLSVCAARVLMGLSQVT